MTAEEIRKAKFEHDDGTWETARWLQECAAQLAELNAKVPQFSAVKFTQEEKTVTGKAPASVFEAVFGKSIFDR